MKKITKNLELAGALGLALFCFGLNFATATTAAQESGRERVIASAVAAQEKLKITIESKSEPDFSIALLTDGKLHDLRLKKGKKNKFELQNELTILYPFNRARDLQFEVNGRTLLLPTANPYNSAATSAELKISRQQFLEFLQGQTSAIAFPPAPKATPPPAPVVSVTQTPTPVPTPPAPVQTLPQLQTRIRQSLARAELRRGQVGVKVVSLDTGRVIFDENSEKYFMPASNMKSYTVAAALARLTPNFRFITSVYALSMPDAAGTIRGDLTIYGRGDPSISAAFNNGDYYKGMDALAQKIAAAGVKRIEGNLIGDESYFNTEAVPATWEWDDLQWYYGAEVSALTVNDNALDLVVRPGASAGAAATVALLPNAYGMTIVNRVTTGAAGTKREISVYRRLGSNVLEISGTIPANLDKYQSSVAAARPALVFVSMLRQLLEQKGITVAGQTRAVNAREKAVSAVSSQLPPIEIARLESAPFALVAAKTMKPSQNLYTELILRALGEQVGDRTDQKKTSETRGVEAVQSFLTEAGIAPGSVVQYDGSGLSRHDLITPASSVQLYDFMSRHAYASAWRESLTIAGVDGTLQNRFRGTPATNNVRGKTGTIDQVSSLSGYLTTAAGERLVFSVLTNGIPQGRIRTETIDEIVLALTNFNGRTN